MSKNTSKVCVICMGPILLIFVLSSEGRFLSNDKFMQFTMHHLADFRPK